MSTLTCNKCLKQFSNNYNYNRHINKKTTCKKLISTNTITTNTTTITPNNTLVTITSDFAICL